MRRSTGASATGRWPPPGPRSASTRTASSPRPGSRLAAVGADIACAQARDELIGRAPTDDVLERAGAAAAAACSPVADQRGSVEYKRHVAGVLTIRALERAAARAQSGPAG